VAVALAAGGFRRRRDGARLQSQTLSPNVRPAILTAFARLLRLIFGWLFDLRALTTL